MYGNGILHPRILPIRRFDLLRHICYVKEGLLVTGSTITNKSIFYSLWLRFFSKPGLNFVVDQLGGGGGVGGLYTLNLLL